MDQEPPLNSTLTLVERADILTKIYATVKMYFAHWEGLPHDFDFEAVFREALEDGLTTEDRRAFSLRMMALLASLRNGHTGYTDPYLQQPFGFRLEYVEGVWVVTHSGYADLPVGTVVDTVDGLPTEAFFAKHRHIISASNEAAARHNFNVLYRVLGETVDLRLADGRTVTLARDAALPTADETTGRWLTPDHTAYIHIPSFGNPSFEARAVELVKAFQAASHLIIDVRDNGGGSTPRDLIEVLLRRPAATVGNFTPFHIGEFDAYAQSLKLFRDNMAEWMQHYLEPFQEFGRSGIFTPADRYPGDKAIYHGQVIILTNGYTGSAAEDFVIPFKNSGQATLIGTTTEGSTGQPYFVQYENGISFRVSTKRVYFPNGTPFEGIGVVPDIEVAPMLADFQSGQDRVLEAALDFIRRA